MLQTVDELVKIAPELVPKGTYTSTSTVTRNECLICQCVLFLISSTHSRRTTINSIPTHQFAAKVEVLRPVHQPSKFQVFLLVWLKHPRSCVNINAFARMKKSEIKSDVVACAEPLPPRTRRLKCQGIRCVCPDRRRTTEACIERVCRWISRCNRRINRFGSKTTVVCRRCSPLIPNWVVWCAIQAWTPGCRVVQHKVICLEDPERRRKD